MKQTFLSILAVTMLIFTGCDSSSDDDSGSSTTGGSATTVTLSAFTNFTCSASWTTRDGARGLKARSGSGTCQATFSGTTGKYRVILKIQTEFDGQPLYNVTINDQSIGSGTYPLSSNRGCGCVTTWVTDCPDKNVDIDLGVHTVTNGDTIKFHGTERWSCSTHGAYAKWHHIRLVPAN